MIHRLHAANDGGADVATEVRGNDGATVVSQRVDLAIGDAPAAIVHSLVHDLCVANTPTVLWWRASARHGRRDSRSNALIAGGGRRRSSSTPPVPGAATTR